MIAQFGRIRGVQQLTVHGKHLKILSSVIAVALGALLGASFAK